MNQLTELCTIWSFILQYTNIHGVAIICLDLLTSSHKGPAKRAEAPRSLVAQTINNTMSHVPLVKVGHEAAQIQGKQSPSLGGNSAKALCKGHGRTESWKIRAIFAITCSGEVMKIKLNHIRRGH